MKNDSLLTRHLHEANEDYLTHLKFTLRTSFRMVAGGMAILAHGIAPFLFERTGSDTIEALHAELQERKKVCAERCHRREP